jgi:hypothetical protein
LGSADDGRFLPVRLLLVTLAGRVNRHQQHVIEYPVEENRALREQLTGRCVRLTDDQRRRLAAKGRRAGDSTTSPPAWVLAKHSPPEQRTRAGEHTEGQHVAEQHVRHIRNRTPEVRGDPGARAGGEAHDRSVEHGLYGRAPADREE